MVLPWLPWFRCCPACLTAIKRVGDKKIVSLSGQIAGKKYIGEPSNRSTNRNLYLHCISLPSHTNGALVSQEVSQDFPKAIELGCQTSLPIIYNYNLFRIYIIRSTIDQHLSMLYVNLFHSISSPHVLLRTPPLGRCLPERQWLQEARLLHIARDLGRGQRTFRVWCRPGAGPRPRKRSPWYRAQYSP